MQFEKRTHQSGNGLVDFDINDVDETALAPVARELVRSSPACMSGSTRPAWTRTPQRA